MSSSQARAEAIRVTWPLPWWLILVPAVLLAGHTMFQVFTATGWLYISPSRLSGLPTEVLAVTGPFISAYTAWVAWRFSSRSSPLASPVSPLVGGPRR